MLDSQDEVMLLSSLSPVNLRIDLRRHYSHQPLATADTLSIRLIWSPNVGKVKPRAIPPGKTFIENSLPSSLQANTFT
jgi:hypothetical protein